MAQARFGVRPIAFARDRYTDADDRTAKRRHVDPQMVDPQMMECQRADNDMHDDHSQVTTTRRQMFCNRQDVLQRSMHGDSLLLPTPRSRTSCAMFVSLSYLIDVATE